MSLILLSIPTINVILIITRSDPEMAVEINVEWSYRFHCHNKTKINFSIQSLNRVSNIFLHKFRTCLHVLHNSLEVIGYNHIH